MDWKLKYCKILKDADKAAFGKSVNGAGGGGIDENACRDTCVYPFVSENKYRYLLILPKMNIVWVNKWNEVTVCRRINRDPWRFCPESRKLRSKESRKRHCGHRKAKLDIHAKLGEHVRLTCRTKLCPNSLEILHRRWHLWHRRTESGMTAEVGWKGQARNQSRTAWPQSNVRTTSNSNRFVVWIQHNRPFSSLYNDAWPSSRHAQKVSLLHD